jgi:hypothetical protein
MKCPHCGHEKSRVLETRGDRRVRQCGECLKDFSTHEVLAVWAGRDRGWIHEAPPIDQPPLELQQKPRPTKFQKFHPASLDDGLDDADPHLADLLLSWWNESRWSKNKSASWTRKAWLLNINRVLSMPLPKATALAQRGVEQGWQSLQEDYVNDVSSAPVGVLMPKDSAMQRALETWKP